MTSGDTDGGEEGVGATVITHGDVPPVLEPAEHVFNLVALLVEFPVVFDLSFMVLPGRNARRNTLFSEGCLNQSAS